MALPILILRLSCRSAFEIPECFATTSVDDEDLGRMFLPPADFYLPSSADRSLSAIDLGQSSCEEDEVLGRMFLPPRDFYIPSSLDTAMSRMSLGGRCGVCDLNDYQDPSWRSYLCSLSDLSRPVTNKVIRSRIKRLKK